MGWGGKVQVRRCGMVLAGLLLAARVSATPEDIHKHPTQVTDEELFESVDLERPGLEAVKAAVQLGDYGAAGEAWATYFRGRQRPTMHFDRDEWADIIRADYPQLAEVMVEKADAVAAGDISHFTIRFPVDGREIDWFHNPKKDSNYVSIVGSQWFYSPLGRAYLLRGDEKYAEAFAWVFDSWFEHQAEIEEKQGGLGSDTIYHAYYPGVRARILCDTYYALAESPALTPELHVKLLKVIVAAAAWLYAKNGGYHVGNQQVGAVSGMGIAGMFLPELKASEAWRERCVQRMGEHLVDDFFGDGAHKELCTQYHKTMLRDMGYVSLVAQRNGLPSFYDEGDESQEAFERAYEWLARMVMPSAMTPAIHSAIFGTDYAVHLHVAGEQFGRPDFLWLADRFWQKGLAPNQKAPFAIANYIVNSPRPTGPTEPPAWLSDHLPESGFAVMRTGWEAGERYLLLQYGWANTGHAFPGALHYCLEMNGEVVATSPGSPRSYALPSYRYCHSTRSHNVVTIDGANHQGPGSFAPGGELQNYVTRGGVWYVRASHRGYERQFGVVCERQVLALENGPIIIRDKIIGGHGHRAQWNFHTPLEVEEAGPGRLTLTGKATYALALAEPETLSGPAVEQRWVAVPPELCQPGDCGKEVPAIAFERAIEGQGTEFVAAIIEGTGGIEKVAGNEYEVTWGEESARVRLGDAACSVVRNGEEMRVE